jgi:hypothetical protein
MRIFKSVLAVVALVGALVSALTLSAAENSIEQLLGTYQGEVYNNVDLDPVTTIFKLERNGHLVGEYIVDEEDGEFRGRISGIQFEGPNAISFEWTDKFGEGFATIEFSKDYQSFAGEWIDKLGSDPLPWNGKKQK